MAIRLRPVGCAKENPVRIRNDTVTVNGELFLNTTGKPGRESSVEPSQENCLIVRSRIRGLRICILNNNTELLFMYLYCAENHV